MGLNEDNKYKNLRAMANVKARKWWIILLISILITALAIWVFIKPVEAFAGLALLFAWSIMVSGWLNVLFSLHNRKSLDSWLWFLFLGILEIVLSIGLFLQPHISALSLIVYVGFWLTFKAVMNIAYSLEVKKIGFRDWWIVLVGGILTLIFSFMMIINPVFGALTVTYLTGLTLLFTGLFGLFLSFKLKRIESFLSI